MIIINPTELSEDHIFHLMRKFGSSVLISQQDTHHDEHIGVFRLQYSLIGWKDANGVMGFEVFDAKSPLAQGGQGVVYSSLGTLSVVGTGLVFVAHSSHVIKTGDPSRFSLVERSLHLLPSRLQCKPLTVVNRTAYLIMKKIPGVTLMQFLQEQGCSLSVAQRFTLSLALFDELIDMTQNLRICHRDIKPTNIMVHLKRRSVHVGIIDFGLSCFLTQDSPKESSMMDQDFQGTHVFVSPEQICGLPAHVKSDAFSLAVVLGMIWGARLRPRQPGFAVFSQGIEYARHMDFTHTLKTPTLPRAALRALENILTSMSMWDAETRLGLVEARAQLVTIMIGLDAGIYDANRGSSPLTRRPVNMPNCWLKRDWEEERPMPTVTSGVFSVTSDESSLRRHTPAAPDSAASPPTPCMFFQSPKQPQPPMVAQHGAAFNRFMRGGSL